MFEDAEPFTVAVDAADSPKARHRQAQRAYRAREKLKDEIREGVFLKLAQKHQEDALAFAEEIADARGMDFNEVMEIFLFRHGK